MSKPKRWIASIVGLALGFALYRLISTHPSFDRGAFGALVLGTWLVWVLYQFCRNFWQAYTADDEK